MLLELRNIHKQFGEQIIFDDLNIDFSSSGFYLLSGKSGSGKTTLLNMIAGYEPVEKGERISNAKMACIFQSYELISELTVLENIRMSVELHGEVFDEHLMKQLGIEEIKYHYPDELSGGQKQRVGIARALYQNPDIILCDEPTESLDIDNKEIVLNLLKEISKEKVVIVACHELSIVDAYFDYHYAIEDKQLVLKEQRKPFKKSRMNQGAITYHKLSLKRYIHRIISKRTLYAVISFCVLIILQIVVYDIDVKMFTPKTSLEALNGHVIYVNLFDVDSSYLSHVGLESKPIVIFEPINIDGKKYQVNVYPMENENYSLKSNEIIINTLALELFENKTKESIIGKEISLNYKIGSIKLEKIYTIKNVVEETDAYYAQIYYDYNSLLDTLNPNLQEKFKDESSNYEIITHPTTTTKLYKSLSDNQRIMTSHSILDVRLENEKMMSLYHLLFRIIEIIALVTTIICILYFNKKDTDKNKTALSLIYSLQVPMKNIKIVYFIEKTKYMLLGSLLIVIVMFVLKNKIAMSYTLVIFLIYLLSLAFQMFFFKAKDISMILKENKD